MDFDLPLRPNNSFVTSPPPHSPSATNASSTFSSPTLSQGQFDSRGSSVACSGTQTPTSDPGEHTVIDIFDPDSMPSAIPTTNGTRFESIEHTNGFTNGHANGHATKNSNGFSNSYTNGTHLVEPPARPVSRRRQSVPLMPPFMVSAPGKVIVYGEHAVVHGKPAIAAAIALRSYLLVTFKSKSRRTVSLRFPDIALDHSWNMDALPWAAFQHPSKKKFYYDLVTTLDQDLLDAIQPYVKEVSPDTPEHIRKIHQASATAFLYLFLSLGSPRSAPATYTLRSTIPIGAGLGSSATIAVCLSAALLLQIRALSGPHPDQPGVECATQIERINRWAFVAECCIHGNPSGVDNTVSAGGKAVLFKRADYAKPPMVQSLNSFPELPLLLINTRQSRSTAVEVAKVNTLKKTNPRIADGLLDCIGDVTESAHEMIMAENFNKDDPNTIQHLGDLVNINHGLLVSLGVSHPKLERVREIIDCSGCGWTKLTGAGGGGCAISLLKPSIMNGPLEPAQEGRHQRTQALADLDRRLEDEGFETFETTLAGDGVGVLWPAVLHNGSEEEGGEEIDQEKFLCAQGNEGIERLVGVAKSLEVGGSMREGWKFWRV